MIRVRDLAIELRPASGAGAPVRAVDGVSFELAPGRGLALVGASGSGKSTLALALLGLLPDGARVVRGSIEVFGREVVGAREAELRALRGRDVAIVFQDPSTALNPLQRIGAQLAEAARAHGASKAAAEARALEVLARVRLPDPQAMARRFPHELSGGQRQRVMIAMALVPEPKVLIADEATSALDPTVQAEILGLFRELRATTDTALLLVTHDLAIVPGLAEELAVLQDGRIVEQGPLAEVLRAPKHAFTRALVLLAEGER